MADHVWAYVLFQWKHFTAHETILGWLLAMMLEHVSSQMRFQWELKSTHETRVKGQLLAVMSDHVRAYVRFQWKRILHTCWLAPCCDGKPYVG